MANINERELRSELQRIGLTATISHSGGIRIEEDPQGEIFMLRETNRALQDQNAKITEQLDLARELLYPNPDKCAYYPKGHLPKVGDLITFGEQIITRIISIEDFRYYCQDGGHFHQTDFEKGRALVVAAQKKPDNFSSYLYKEAVVDVCNHFLGPNPDEPLNKRVDRLLNLLDSLNVPIDFMDHLTTEAVTKVRGSREQEYGNKLINFQDIANLENAQHRVSDRTPETVAIDMILTKLARLRKSPDHYDTLVDLIGYVLCYRDIRKAQNPELYYAKETRFTNELASGGKA